MMSAQEADDGQTQRGPHGSALDFGIHLSGIGVGGASRGGEGGHFWVSSFVMSLQNFDLCLVTTQFAPNEEHSTSSYPVGHHISDPSWGASE